MNSLLFIALLAFASIAFTETEPPKKCCGIDHCAGHCILCAPNTYCGLDTKRCPICENFLFQSPLRCCGKSSCGSHCILCSPDTRCEVSDKGCAYCGREYVTSMGERKVSSSRKDE